MEEKYSVKQLEYDELFEIEERLQKFTKEIDDDYKKTGQMERGK